MTDIVLSPFYPVADKIDTSHRAGWARYWARELGATLLTTGTMDQVAQAKKGDTLYLYHGMEWNGSMNLQSGLTPEIKDRAHRLIDAHKRGVKIISLDVPMPSYGKLIAARTDADDVARRYAELLDKALKNRGFLSVPTERPKHVIMGDSHSLSLYRPDGVIYRTDGQTLNGALAIGLQKRLEAWQFETQVELLKLGLLTSYFGNIDVRHHLLRQPDPKEAARLLAAAYCKQLAGIQFKHKIGHIEVAEPLPIENESRLLPKTGWYKGTPFFGTWKQRDDLRKYLRDRLKTEAKKHGFTVYSHPKHFTNKQGELTFDVMEQPRSVHIRPSEYRLMQEKKSW